MKGKIKKTAAIAGLTLTLMLSGCSDAAFGADSMLRPPRATGDKAEIQDILSKEAGGSYTLKYPQAGDNRSAIIMRNENTKNEYALALYSTEKDTKLNASVITYRENAWECAGTFSNTGSGIDRVLFKDINGDKNEEILIGWTAYNSAKKTMTAYSMTSEGVYEMKVDETYDELVVANIVNDKADDIVLLSLSTQEAPSTATLLQYSEEKKRPIGKYSLELDSAVIAFTGITVGEVAVNTENADGIKITATGAPSETSHQESSRKESSRAETGPQSSAQEESKKPGTVNEQSGVGESSKAQQSRQESSQAQQSRQESSQAEQSGEEPSRIEPSKQESDKQESGQEEPVKEEPTEETSRQPVTSDTPITKLNTTGIVLDCTRSDNTICTQMVYYDKMADQLINPLSVKNNNDTFTNPTVRTDPVYCRDINSDGVIDIPVVSPMMADVDEAGTNVCNLTSWQNYDAMNRKMKTVLNTVINLKDGYYYIVPERWNGTVTARSNAETRELTFYLWNSKTSSAGDKLLTLYRFTEQQWKEADTGSMFRLDSGESGTKAIYAAQIYETSAQDELNTKAEEVNNNFRLL